MKTLKIMAALLVFNCHCGYSQTVSPQSIISNLKLPAGFKISIFAQNLPNARSLALGDNGIVYVGSTQAGKVYAAKDADKNGIAEKTYTIAQGLKLPNGVAYKNGALYVGAVNRILRYDQIGQRLSNPPAPKVIYSKFPSDTHHGWKYLRFGPDGKLYSAIGAPCNICNPASPYATMVRLNPDGSGVQTIAKGIRNTVGFDWQPGTGTLYFSENGRDRMGDNIPPDELNRWSGVIGQHFGYPYCHGGYIVDPGFGGGKKCSQFTAPAWKFNAHNAPLGIKFYRGAKFPATYRNQLLVAFHGSWNRTIPQGYRIDMLKVNNGQVSQGANFISGWLTSDYKVLGRPVDILEMPDGSILISDDKNGLIYRVTYQG